MDVSHRAWRRAHSRLRLEDYAADAKERIRLIQGSLIYRTSGSPATMPPQWWRSSSTWIRPTGGVRARAVRVRAPATVVVTTPNVEYNVKFETCRRQVSAQGSSFRMDAREVRSMGQRHCERFGYTVRFLPVGPKIQRGRAHPDGGLHSPMKLTIPELALVVLIGLGSGKSTFARTHFQADGGDVVGFLPRPGLRR